MVEEPAATLRLILVHEVRLYRDLLCRALSEHGGFTVVADVDAYDGPLQRPDFDFDAVLLDGGAASAPGVAREILAERPETRVIAFGVPPLEPTILAWVEAGVSGFVGADCSLDDLPETLDAACRGELRSASIAGVVLRAASRNGPRIPRNDLPGSQLTDRELEVVALIERGFSNKEIASELALGVSTVKHHVHSILNKMKIRRRSQVAARRSG